MPTLPEGLEWSPFWWAVYLWTLGLSMAGVMYFLLVLSKGGGWFERVS